MSQTDRCAGATAGHLALSCLLMLIIGVQAARGSEAERILEATRVTGGLVVHVGCGDGNLTAALGVSGRYLVHGLDADSANIEKAREHIRARTLSGSVSVEQWPGKHLPYADNLVNLLVSKDLNGIPMTEVMRTLRPLGVAYLKVGGEWTRTIKAWPSEMDEWTHYLRDATGNAVARDTLVAPPRHLQWVAKPLWCRSHEVDSGVSALVSARGRVFYILDEGLTGVTDERLPAQWSLVARDAFNGVLLWKRALPHWGWREWKKAELEGKNWATLRGQRTRSPDTLAKRLVAEGDRVYVTLGYRAPVSVLDAATGEIVRTCAETSGADEILSTNGTLVICVRDLPLRATTRPSSDTAAERLVAIQAETGDVLWRHRARRIVPLSSAIEGGRVFFNDREAIVCLDLTTGAELWRVPGKAAKGRLWRSAHTLVAHNGVVLWLGPKKLVARSAETGKTLWTAPGAKGPGAASPPDLFVAVGLVWYGRDGTGRDPMTGEVRRTVEAPNLISPGHHFRCYRSKATDRYLLWPKRGVEFLDLRAENHARHDWLRATCRLGFMPCNGLLYMPPHQCFCYPGVKLTGFNALAGRMLGGRTQPEDASTRLKEGPAYKTAMGDPNGADAQDWPTHRRDHTRSGSTTSAVPVRVDRLWHAELSGRIAQPVVAAGRLFVASVDTHTVHALDAKDGKPLWSHTAGGRVDSSPTIHQGRVLFGAADGWVYCLRAADGELVWRFRAAPEARRVVAFGQLESAWPVHGSVLVQDGIAYLAAGRSSFLDGGIYVYGLDVKTGRTLHETRLDGPHPDATKDIGRPFDMEGALPDILVGDSESLFMHQVKFDRTLAVQDTPRITRMGDRKLGLHLFSTAGLLDGSWWNRTFWMYGERWPGFYIANQASKSGQLLVFDDTTTYGVKCYTKRNRHSPMFFPGKEGYLLFADDNDNEPHLRGKSDGPKPVKWLPPVDKSIGFVLDGQAVDRDKATGFTRIRPPKWATWVPIRIRAMVLAGGTLFIAGPPDVIDPADPLAAFEGRKGGLLRAVSSADGTTLAEYQLDSPPVFDGMIAAKGRLYISTRDGRLTCLGKRR